MKKGQVGRPPGHCSICNHEDRSRAELLLAGGASQQSVATKFAMSPDAVGRHWRGHVSEERKASLLMGPVQRMELAARVSEEAEAVIDHFRTVRAGLYTMFNAALEAGDRKRLANSPS